VDPKAQAFAPTRWTLVARARGETPEARAALAELCEAYYDPVLNFLSQEGRTHDEARELTQEFFARVLGGNGFENAYQQHGRFRSYLLGALKHFLADQRKSQLRLKRGGGKTMESIDATKADEGGLQFADTSLPPIEAVFDREWALSIIARCMRRLEQDFTADGKADQFSKLKGCLIGENVSFSQSEAALQLGLSEGAVKVAIHRLRKRFREAVRSELSQTLVDPSLVDEELQHLIAALS